MYNTYARNRKICFPENEMISIPFSKQDVLINNVFNSLKWKKKNNGIIIKDYIDLHCVKHCFTIEANALLIGMFVAFKHISWQAMRIQFFLVFFVHLNILHFGFDVHWPDSPLSPFWSDQIACRRKKKNFCCKQKRVSWHFSKKVFFFKFDADTWHACVGQFLIFQKRNYLR